MSYNIIKYQNKLFIKSTKVQVFPCAYRGSRTVTISANNTDGYTNKVIAFQPTSRSFTEENWTKHSTGNDVKTSYLVSTKSNDNNETELRCVLGGYSFILQLTNDDLQVLAGAASTDLALVQQDTPRYLTISTVAKTVDEFTGANGTDLSHSTALLASRLVNRADTLDISTEGDQGSSTLDNTGDKFVFTGLTIENNIPQAINDSGLAVVKLVNNKISYLNEAFRLQDILTTSTGENSIQTVDPNDVTTNVVESHVQKATGKQAIAFGYQSVASGENATTLGKNTIASGTNSLATGNASQASGDNAFTVGTHTKAVGDNSLAIGEYTEAQGKNSVALGKRTKTSAEAESQTVIGKYNAESNAAFVIGNGITVSDRKNVFTVDYAGNMALSNSENNSLSIGGASSGTGELHIGDNKLNVDSAGNVDFRGDLRVGTTGAEELQFVKDGTQAQKLVLKSSLTQSGDFTIQDTENSIRAKIEANTGHLELNGNTAEILVNKDSTENYFKVNQDKTIITDKNTTIYNDLTAANISAAGSLSSAGNLSTNSDLTVAGASTLHGQVTNTGGLSATGDVTLGSLGKTVNITGKTTLTGNTDINGATSVQGNLFTTANLTVSGNADITGTSTLRGQVTIGGNTDLAGDLTTQGSIIANATISASGGNVEISSNQSKISDISLSSDQHKLYSVANPDSSHTGYYLSDNRIKLQPSDGTSFEAANTYMTLKTPYLNLNINNGGEVRVNNADQTQTYVTLDSTGVRADEIEATSELNVGSARLSADTGDISTSGEVSAVQLTGNNATIRDTLTADIVQTPTIKAGNGAVTINSSGILASKDISTIGAIEANTATITDKLKAYSAIFTQDISAQHVESRGGVTTTTVSTNTGMYGVAAKIAFTGLSQDLPGESDLQKECHVDRHVFVSTTNLRTILPSFGTENLPASYVNQYVLSGQIRLQLKTSSTGIGETIALPLTLYVRYWTDGHYYISPTVVDISTVEGASADNYALVIASTDNYSASGTKADTENDIRGVGVKAYYWPFSKIAPSRLVAYVKKGKDDFISTTAAVNVFGEDSPRPHRLIFTQDVELMTVTLFITGCTHFKEKK